MLIVVWFNKEYYTNVYVQEFNHDKQTERIPNNLFKNQREST